MDLNKGASGDYIYLYYTKDSRAGDPLLELYGTESVVDHTDGLYKHQTVRRLWDFKHSDLNAGTTIFTDSIYLVMVSQPTGRSPITASVFGNGSWVAIAVLTFGLMSCLAVAVVVRNKRKNNNQNIKETTQKEEG